MKYLKEILIEIDKKYICSFSVKQLDTARYLLFRILNDGVAFNLSDKKVRAYIKKPDETEVFNDMEIANEESGLAELKLTEQMLAIPGIAKVEISIYEGEDILTTIPFDLTIIETIRDDRSIISSNEYKTLTNALKEINDIDKKFAEVSSQIDEKANKNEIFTMANMGQDIKEAMTGGSVAVVGKNSILEENIVDNQVTPEKISFTKWEDEEILFDEKSNFENIALTNSKDSTGKDIFKVTYKTDDETMEHNYYTALIPINPNSLISIEFKNNNRCRIGVVFSGGLDENGKVIKATKIVENDDNITNTKIETTNATGIYLIAYLGYDTEQTPSLIVKSRPQGSKIILEDVLVKELDKNIKITPEQTTFIYNGMQVERINRAILSSDGKYYYKDVTQEDYDSYNLFLINTKDIDILKDFQIFNVNGCIRLMGHNSYTFDTLKSAIEGLLIGKGDNFGGEKILFSETSFLNFQDIDVSKYSIVAIYVGKNIEELDSPITKKYLKDINVNLENIEAVNIEKLNSQRVELEYTSKKILARENGKLYAFLTDNEDSKYCIHLELEEYATYRIKAENINRCRIALFEKNIKDITFVNETSGYKIYADKILLNDDDLSSIDITFNSEKYKTCIAYLGLDVVGSETVPNAEIKYSFTNITIPELRINKEQLTFDFDNEVKQIVNKGGTLDNSINDINIIYEFPKASDEWTTNSSNKKLDMTSDQFLEIFYDKLLGYHIEDGLRINKKSLGKDTSGQYDIYEYDFIPPNYEKTILLSSGMHSYELSASFGLAHFFAEYMKYPYASNGFKYLRENVRIKVIPIVNPWGFNHVPYKTYGNCNGVNPNRNFDSLDSEGNSVWDSFPIYSSNKDDENYNEWNVKGKAPFSEQETQILREWVLDNNNSEFWIDCHTGLGYNKYDNWIVTVSANKNLNKIYYALYELEKRIEDIYDTTSRTNKDIDGETAVKHKWCCNVAKVPSMTIEQAPENTLWGTSLNNESGDITEYATTVYAYIIAQLKDVL